jgi:hypothetical protein
MEKIIENKVKLIKTKKIHDFYCDDCGTFIESCTEYDDGYVANDCDFVHKVFVDDKWYILRKQLCYKCKEITFNKIKAALIDLGYKKEEY